MSVEAPEKPRQFTHVYAKGDYLGVIAYGNPGSKICGWRVENLATGTTEGEGVAMSDEVAWLELNTCVLAALKARV